MIQRTKRLGTMRASSAGQTRGMSLPLEATVFLALVALILGCTVPKAAAQETAGENVFAEEPVAEATRPFHLTVIHRETKEPLAGAVLTIRINSDERTEITDAEGRYTVALPREGLTYFRVEARKMDMVPLRLAWRPTSEHVEIPEQYTLTLEPGTTIGGIIQDEQGHLIEGVTVYLLVPGRGETERVAIWDEPARTDAQGRWGCSIMPADLDDIWIRLEHPEYVSDVTYGATPKPPMEKLRDMTGVMVMKRGFEVVGTVVDTNGRAILGASVAQGSDRHGSHYPETATDGNGAFRFPFGRPGEMVLTAQKTGYAPELKVLQVGKGLEPVEFVLGPGNTIRGKVVDVDGNPLAEIPISADGWRGHRSINWYSKTDAEGLFEWSSAPADEVLFDLYPRGYMSVRRFPMTPSEEEYVITMHGLLTVTGRVIDAETKEPIEEFQAMPGIKWSEGQAARWNRREAKTFANGRYGITFDYPRYGHLIRVEADGYLPGISRVFKDDEGEQVFDFELERGTGPSGVVLSPAGEPAGGALVAMALPSQGVHVVNGRASSQRDLLGVETDEQGRFEMAPQTDPHILVALHESGYARMEQDALKTDSTIALQAWATVEGTLKIGDNPGANESVTLVLQSGAPYDPRAPRVSFSCRATTDEQGRFRFDGVPAGEVLIYRSIRLDDRRTVSSHGRRFKIGAGETLPVVVGGTGRPVIGKLKATREIPEGLDFAHYNASLSRSPPSPGESPKEIQAKGREAVQKWHDEWRESSKEYQAYKWKTNSFGIVLESDGSFSVPDVPAGVYRLWVRLRKPPESTRGGVGEEIAKVSHAFEVPEMPGGRSDEPLDLGTLELELKAQ